jgi:hypothetical protein
VGRVAGFIESVLRKENAMELTELVDKKVDECASRIRGGIRTDEVAFGELAFYLALRRVQQNKATTQDIGLMDAINDTLQTLALIGKGETFYKR